MLRGCGPSVPAAVTCPWPSVSSHVGYILIVTTRDQVAMQVPSIEEVRKTVEGRFDVEALEAHGGMGAVFRGRHRSLDSATWRANRMCSRVCGIGPSDASTTRIAPSIWAAPVIMFLT